MNPPAKHTVVAPRPGRPVPPGTILGKVPVKQVAGTNHLTPLEAEMAAKFGVTPEQLPALQNSAAMKRAMAEAITAGKTVTREELAQVRPGPKVEIPVARDVASLPPHEQEEIRQLVDQWNAEQSKPAVPPQLAAIPGMEETLQAAEAIQIVKSVPAHVPQSPSGFSPIRRPAAPPPPAPAEPDPEPEAPAAEAGGMLELTNCPHCNGDVRQSAVKVEDTDRLAYLQEVVLGGRRFRKSYGLFNGHLKVTFRSLLPYEAEAARRQAERDLASGVVVSALGYMELVADYRLVMSIESLQNQPYMTLDELDSPPNESPLPWLRTFFDKEVFKTDSIKRTLGQTLRTFERLSDAIELQANNPDFWSAIDLAS